MAYRAHRKFFSAKKNAFHADLGIVFAILSGYIFEDMEKWETRFPAPICSMYGILTDITSQMTPMYIGRYYSIHGAPGAYDLAMMRQGLCYSTHKLVARPCFFCMIEV